MLYERFIIGAIILVLRTALVGIVIRLRVQYIPKAVVQPDSEKQSDATMTPRPMSFSEMLRRVIRLEGWRGLLKGIVPMALGDAILLLVAGLNDSGVISPAVGSSIAYLSIVYDVPLSIFIIRSVTTTADLCMWDLRGAMRALLSPAERRKPWLLYTTPGLVFVVLFQIIRNETMILSYPSTIDAVIPDKTLIHCMSTRKLAWLVVMLLHQALTSPLEVMKIRLAMQRNLSIPESDADADVDVVSDKTDLDEKFSADTSDSDAPSGSTDSKFPLLHIRTTTGLPPYTGMFHCEQTIVQEEGYGTIFPGRVWWFTMLTNVLAMYGINAAPFS